MHIETHSEKMDRKKLERRAFAIDPKNIDRAYDLGLRARDAATINRHTGRPHEHHREIMRRLKRA